LVKLLLILQSKNIASLNSFSAYIVWILSSYGYTDLDKNLNNLIDAAKYTDDPYFLSLLTLALANLKPNLAPTYANRLVDLQNKTSGAFETAHTSITSSNGLSLTIETTALAMSALLQTTYPALLPQIELGISYLISQIKSGGSFGHST
jgi:hypothetical protein